MGLARGTRGRLARATAAALVLILLLVSAHVPVGSLSASVGAVGRTREGCSCHNVTEALSVEALLTGLPGSYVPGEVYELDISFAGGPAVVGGPATGFDLQASAGELVAPRGSDQVRVDPATGDATHSLEGTNASSWALRWRAPGEDTGQVTVTLVVLVGNGDGAQAPEDAWARGSWTVEEGGKGGIRQAPAFWTVVGVAAVLAIVGLVYIAFQGPRLRLRR
jgi:hypothetical protein